MINMPRGVKYERKHILYGFPCEMDFSALVSEETCGEKNQSHMDNHTKCISPFKHLFSGVFCTCMIGKHLVVMGKIHAKI